MSFRKKRNNPSSGLRRQTADSNYNQVLRIFAEDNLLQYSWGRTFIELLDGECWPELYAFCDRTQVVHGLAEFRLWSQTQALVLKYPRPHAQLGFENPELTAIQKFLDAEGKCLRTNRRFSKARWVRSRYSTLICRMQLIIADILGPFREKEYRDVLDYSAFGPGSNIGVGGDATHIGRKFFSKSWSITPACAPYFLDAIAQKPFYYRGVLKQSTLNKPYKSDLVCYSFQEYEDICRRKLKYVSSNKVSFVPKTAKTHRAIAVEPLGNSFVQKGIDELMRRKLLQTGIDLRDQNRNQDLARIGSINGSLSTIDLSSASDTISRELVRTLIPPDWFTALNCCRSPSYTHPVQKTEHRYEKFSSMGNGFTFPLESLIFLAAVRAVMQHDHSKYDRTHSVYGDDIIVPTQSFKGVVNLLTFLGFKTNKDKTFSSGPFRESCGADWYEGQDVRPVYLDYRLDTDVSLRVFHNSTHRSEWCRDAFTGVREYLRSVHDKKTCYLRPIQEESCWSVDLPSYLARRQSLLRERSLRTPTFGIDWREKANLNGAFAVEVDAFIGSRWARWNRESQCWSWKEILFLPVADKRFNGSDAQYWALLLGSPGGELYLRRRTRRATVVKL